VLAAAILFTGVVTLARALFLKGLHEREREGFALDRRHKLAAVVVGVLVGFMLGVTSAGSGALIALFLILAFRLVPRRVVGTDVFHAALLLWAAALAHLVAGNVDFALAGTLLIGRCPACGSGATGRYGSRSARCGPSSAWCSSAPGSGSRPRRASTCRRRCSPRFRC
jgi:uncharacterized protein